MQTKFIRFVALHAFCLVAISLIFAPGARSQWYASGNVGATFTNDADTPISAAGITVNGDAEFDTGIAATGALGFSMGNLRLEGEFSYRTQDVKNYTATSVSGPGFGTITGVAKFPLSDTDTSVWALMANGWYDFDTGSKWRPYLGGGIGIAFTNLNIGTSDTGSNQFDDNDTVFAYQAGAGLDFEINAQTRVGVSYRYFGTSDPKYSDTVGGIPFKIESEVTNHSILFGVLHKF